MKPGGQCSVIAATKSVACENDGVLFSCGHVACGSEPS